MSSPAKASARASNRFPYLTSGVVLYKGQKHAIKIKALGQEGILFKCTHAFMANEHVGLGWRDKEAGIIRGTFAILAQRQTPQKTAWYYYARFIKVEPDIQQAILQIIARIRKENAGQTRVTLGHIEQLIDLGPRVFAAPRDQIQSLQAVHILETVSAEELQFLTHPQTEDEKDLQALQTLSLEARMIDQFLNSTPSMNVDQMKRVLTLTHSCFKNIIALEKTEGFAKRADVGDEEVTENPKTEALHRYLIIASNQTYETVSQIYTYFEQGQWIKAIESLPPSDQDVHSMKANVQDIETLFKEEFELSYDETSFGEAVLTKTIFEETQNKKKHIMTIRDDRNKPSKPWFRLATGVLLMGALAFRLWVLFIDDGNIQEKLSNRLLLPIPTQRIVEDGQSLIIVFSPHQWTLANEPTRQEAQLSVEQFLNNETKYNSAFAFSDDNKLLFARTKQSPQ